MDSTGTTEQDVAAQERIARGASLTDRDRELVGYLAVARYLSTEQVQRLFYPGRLTKVCRRRLLRLAGMWKSSQSHPTRQGVQENFDPPYLRRREFRSFEGELREVWALTDAGYGLAERVLKRQLKVPRSDVSAEFLEHSITLSELLVALVEPASRQCAQCGRFALAWRKVPRAQRELRLGGEPERYVLACGTADEKGCGRESPGGFPHPAELPFRWTTTEDTRLPWTEYDRKSGKTLDRLIQPDGLLELMAPRRRVFLECEMGTHSIVGNEHKGGASIAKAERYEKFIEGLADPKTGETFYARQFPDRAPPEVLFLVTSDVRRDGVNGALAQWRKEGHRLEARALTTLEAARLFADGTESAAGQPASPPKLPHVSQSDVRELQRFFNDVIRATKAARAAARAKQAEVPEYPAASERVGRLVGRLLEEVAQDGHSNGGAR